MKKKQQNKNMKKQQKKKKGKFKTFAKWSGATLLLITVLGAAGTGLVMQHYSKEATTVSLNLSKQPIENSFTILDANGKPLQSNKKFSQFLPIYPEGKQQNVSDFYIQTLINVEDSTFYSRKTRGYEIKDTAKAVLLSVGSKLHIIPQHEVRGGSSIDQQLIKTLVFGGSNAEMTISRKIIEVLDSHSLASRYSRNEILQAYLDSIRLTPDTIGVRAAYSDLFGDSDMTKLNVDSAEGIAKTAFMAGLGQAPSQYVQYFDKAPKGYLTGKQRALIVLGVMKERELISENQYDETKEYIKSDKFKLNASRQNGVDPAYQSYVSYVNKELKELSLPTNSSIEIKTFATQEKLKELDTIARGQYQLQPAIPYQEFPSEKDNSAIAVIDTKTGHILGLATNSSDPTVPFTSIHSSGSTIKPLIDFAPALEYGKITPNSVLNGNGANHPGGITYSGMQPGLAASAPQNYGGQNWGSVNASFALSVSLNSAALQTFKMTTNDQKLSLLQPLGIAKTFNDHLDENENADETLSINYTISMLEEASAYSAFGNDGVRISPTSISSIKIDGKDTKPKEPQAVRAMSSSTARNIAGMLQGVTKPNGSEPLAASQYIGQKAGNYMVKSGLSNYPQAEMAQYSPDALMSYASSDISVSVWFGAPNMSTNYEWGIPNGTGNLPENNTRVYLLNSTVKAMMEGRQSEGFKYSRERMQPITKSSLAAPNLNPFFTPGDIKSIKDYNPQMKKIDPKDKKFYDEHVNDELITPNDIAK